MMIATVPGAGRMTARTAESLSAFITYAHLVYWPGLFAFIAGHVSHGVLLVGCK